MKKLMPSLVGVMFALFVAAVFVGIVSMSFKGLGYIFPNDLFDQAIGLVLFDVAALTWFGVLIYLCTSTAQYTFSLIGFVVGLFGTFGLIGIEVGISSGMLIAAQMTKPLTYIFIGVFMGHLSLIYFYHAAAPDVDAKISLGIDKAKVVDEGRKQAEEHLAKALPQLGAAISQRLIDEVMQDLGLQPQMIDAKFLPLDVSENSISGEVAENKLKPGAVWLNWFKGVKREPRQYEKAVSMPVQVLKENKPGAVDGTPPAAIDEMMFYDEKGLLRTVRKDADGKMQLVDWDEKEQATSAGKDSEVDVELKGGVWHEVLPQEKGFQD